MLVLLRLLRGLVTQLLVDTRQGFFKFGIEIPKTWDDILRLDGAAGNKKWQAAVHKELAALIHHDCFDFHSPDFRPPSGYQYVRLNLVYDVKADLT
jgi:hypothetical protein